MKIEVQATVNTTEELDLVVKEVSKIEEEYSCNCTLHVTLN